MLLLHRSAVGLLGLALIATACKNDKETLGPRDGTPRSTIAVPNTAHMTMGSGSTSTLLGRATFADATKENLDVKRKSDDWRIQLKANPAFDIAVQSIDFQPNGQSGWHQHPGPVFIQVVLGTLTFYESTDPDCTPIVRTAGQGYLDLGEYPHIARNESGALARTVVTYFAPPGAQLKSDAPNPGNCPF
ncbi:MAG TPA: hypothetical protein VJ852_07795 [Gemmatimonadaceae bacterium]|nr:hypothetical protein [Gemmatimonadaceae bacterium]